MAKIAVLGASGHYGTSAVHALLGRGVRPDDIIAVYRSKPGTLGETNVALRRGGDYSGETFGPAVLKGAEKLLFISGGGMDNLQRIADHLAVVRAAREAGISHIVYTSMAYPDRASNLFGLETVHLATEAMIRAAGIPYTFLRNTFYADYFLSPAALRRAVDTGKLMSLARGAGVNFVLRENMAEAAAAVLTTQGHGNKTYTITAPHAYTYRDIAKMLTEVSGKQVGYIETTPEKYRAYLSGLGVSKEAQAADTTFSQPAFTNGWASGVSGAMVDLIGGDRYVPPGEIVRRALQA